MRDVVWSESALHDTNEIVAYIASDNPAAAAKVLDWLELTAQRLGRLAVGRSGRVEGTYEKSVVGMPYIIAYAIRPLTSAREQVVILRVIHAARNWPKGRWPK